jgi:single-strand DNA-binding protein
MLNKIVIMGRLTNAPELKVTTSGKNVVSFSVAVDRDFKGQNGEKETDFINCVAWQSTAEFISKYFNKGSMAVISGRLQTRKYETQDGKKGTATEVIVENIYFGESKKETTTDNSEQAPPSDFTLSTPAFADSDLPF